MVESLSKKATLQMPTRPEDKLGFGIRIDQDQIHTMSSPFKNVKSAIIPEAVTSDITKRYCIRSEHDFAS